MNPKKYQKKSRQKTKQNKSKTNKRRGCASARSPHSKTSFLSPIPARKPEQPLPLFYQAWLPGQHVVRAPSFFLPGWLRCSFSSCGTTKLLLYRQLLIADCLLACVVRRALCPCGSEYNPAERPTEAHPHEEPPAFSCRIPQEPCLYGPRSRFPRLNSWRVPIEAVSPEGRFWIKTMLR